MKIQGYAPPITAMIFINDGRPYIARKDIDPLLTALKAWIPLQEEQFRCASKSLLPHEDLEEELRRLDDATARAKAAAKCVIAVVKEMGLV